MACLIDALVLRCANLAACERFYRAIGLPLEREQHGDGPVHFACELGELHFAIYSAKPSVGATGSAQQKNEAGSSMFGFRVDSVDDAFSAALKAGGSQVIRPDDYPWGRRAVVGDPDGRPVELNGTCPGKFCASRR